MRLDNKAIVRAGRLWSNHLNCEVTITRITVSTCPTA
jgi:hypothetical protein